MTTRKPFSAHDLDIDNSGSPISRMLRGKTSRPPTEEEIVDRTRREVYRGVLARCDVDAAEDASATTLLLQVDEAIGRLRSAPYSDPPPRTQCARCGLIEVCGEREDEPVCARCVWEMLDEARRERDEAQAKSRFMVASTLDTAVRWGLIFEWELLPSGNVCLIDNEGRRDLPPLDAVNALAEQWGKIARERDDLRNAARAVVVAKVRPCYICDKVSTVADLDDAFCEAHADLARIDKQDTDGAPAWRRLCALVKP